ncbi:unnamed protein product [Meloidogyne enterolobii]|uniref:Uncharacterized protein n=1 Tax=Meloidogyne enterolobii TaxID=390850 RepID=A0ACB1AMN5_MELEN
MRNFETLNKSKAKDESQNEIKFKNERRNVQTSKYLKRRNLERLKKYKTGSLLKIFFSIIRDPKRILYIAINSERN